jgi:polyhydroxyalkanoate synthase
MGDRAKEVPKAGRSRPRMGPRPLPLHLGTAALTWMSSRAALPLLMSGLLPWKPALVKEAAALRASLDGVDPEAFARALEAEVRRRLDLLLRGFERYRHHPYRRNLADPPAIWTEGGTRLLDYGTTANAAKSGAVVLFVPSLVNRGYILDLAEGNSFLRWLAGRGLRPLLVDWGQPGADERSYDLTDYIAGRLERALEAATALAGGPVGLAGYCMGGNLALSLALRRPKEVQALALLATPWDFHADRPELARAVAASAEPMLRVADRLGELSTDVLQALFFMLDPYLAPRKFLRFATFEPGSPRELAFVALEDWLNDGVPLVAQVARECLQGWYGANTPGRGLWRVAGSPVDPRAIALPTLVLVPAQDRIVPPLSAEALVQLIPGAERLQPTVGHIGMMVSGVAESAVWRPLAQWLGRHLAARPTRRRKAAPPASLPSQMQQTYNSPEEQGKKLAEPDLRRNSR